jgi:hypothetical protein
MQNVKCARITRFYLINCISYTAVQTIDTDLRKVGLMCKKTVSGTQNCVRWSVCLCSIDKTRKYYSRTVTKRDISFEVTGELKKKLQSDELNNVSWELNAGRLWTDRQWDKRSWLEKLKIHTIVRFESLKGRGNSGDLFIDEMLKTEWWTAH